MKGLDRRFLPVPRNWCYGQFFKSGLEDRPSEEARVLSLTSPLSPLVLKELAPQTLNYILSSMWGKEPASFLNAIVTAVATHASYTITRGARGSQTDLYHQSSSLSGWMVNSPCGSDDVHLSFASEVHCSSEMLLQMQVIRNTCRILSRRSCVCVLPLGIENPALLSFHCQVLTGGESKTLVLGLAVWRLTKEPRLTFISCPLQDHMPSRFEKVAGAECPSYRIFRRVW